MLGCQSAPMALALVRNRTGVTDSLLPYKPDIDMGPCSRGWLPVLLVPLSVLAAWSLPAESLCPLGSVSTALAQLLTL